MNQDEMIKLLADTMVAIGNTTIEENEDPLEILRAIIAEARAVASSIGYEGMLNEVKN